MDYDNFLHIRKINSAGLKNRWKNKIFDVDKFLVEVGDVGILLFFDGFIQPFVEFIISNKFLYDKGHKLINLLLHDKLRSFDLLGYIFVDMRCFELGVVFHNFKGDGNDGGQNGDWLSYWLQFIRHADDLIGIWVDSLFLLEETCGVEFVG